MKKKILFLASNPKNTEQLRLTEENREINSALERSKHRDNYKVINKLAVRPDDLRQALLDHVPYIVHFSGHGGGEDGLCLEDDSGQIQMVSVEALSDLFGLFAGKIECVLLNACYSEVQAETIHRHINYVIGMSQSIGDKAAIKFSAGFYDALGAGRSFKAAYNFGCNAIDLENIPGNLTPSLKIRVPQPAHSKEIEPLELEEPDGQVPLKSAYYVKRPPLESDCYKTIEKPGSLIRIKGPRQMGKTSLMTRIQEHGISIDYNTISLSFKEADRAIYDDLDIFLKWFCSSITYGIDLPDEISHYWKGILGSINKCTKYFQKHILPGITKPMILCLDDVDEVFQYYEIATDFFGLLRIWHEKSKNDDLWKKLRLVIVHSKEAYIPLDHNQSPFNVGVPIEIVVLNFIQVEDLISRHELNWDQVQIDRLMSMLGGHPYLLQVALREIVRGRQTLETLLRIAPTEEGPYSDHLRRHLLNIEKAGLIESIKKLVTSDKPVKIDATDAFKLHSMGIALFKGNALILLCDLYRQYFISRLRNN